MRGLMLIAVAAFATAFFMGGKAPLGRVLMAAGLPGIAGRLLEDPQWQGAAYYRAKRYDDAALAFAEAQDFYNLGNAEAHRGHHAAALEAFDRALAEGDTDARANFDVVAAYYAGLGIDPDSVVLAPKRENGPETESFIARGNARAAGTGSGVTNNNTMLGLAQVRSRGEQSVRQIFDDNFMIADERWLAQLSDVPGEFMAARIATEHKRRVKAGLSPPQAEDPR